ncbi:calcium/sodium antiporter [Candidatus Woesearchaeota archaeon]|nr:calcium/sodium antiporter [Candidatus Woesearchaeota archaeon]
MLDILLWVGVLVLSLAVLVKASDYFTDSAETIGVFLRLPPFIIGVTIVAIGTSLPELVSSIVSVFKGAPEIVVGNVVGSNIANIFLVLGLAAILGRGLKIGFELIHVDLPLLIGSAFLLGVTVWDGVFTLAEGIVCLAGLAIYLVYTIRSERVHDDDEIKKETASEIKARRKRLRWTTWLVLVLSAFFIYLGAEYTVESVIKLSGLVGIGTEIIAVSAVALGTSLPELVVSVQAARKGKPEIAVGNILGSNIFNSFAVMGIPALFATLPIPKSILIFSLPMMLIATLMYFFITQDKHISKWEGWMLLLFYVVFIGKLFGFL